MSFNLLCSRRYEVAEVLPVLDSMYDPADFEMRHFVAKYVDHRLPPFLYKLNGEVPIKVLGIASHDFVAFCNAQPGWSANPTPIWKLDKNSTFNREKPAFWEVTVEGRLQYFLTVYPGKELVYHYQQLLQQWFFTYSHSTPVRVQAHYFPEAFNTLPEWTGLSQIGAHARGHIVVLGYVEELANAMIEQGFNSSTPNWVTFGLRGMYKFRCFTVEKDGTLTKLLLLGVRTSYWGTILSRLVEYLVEESGASGILHLAKSGAMVNENCTETINGAPYIAPITFGSPQGWSLWRDSPALWRPGVVLIENILADGEHFNSTGKHVSLSSVLEERSFEMNQIRRKLTANSVDIEASFVALTIERINKKRHPEQQVHFGVVHVVSDYLVNPEAANLVEKPPKLTNHIKTLASQLARALSKCKA